MDPEAEDALVGLPELTRSGEDTAAVDPHGEVECHAILESEKLGALLGTPIKRDRGKSGEMLCKP